MIPLIYKICHLSRYKKIEARGGSTLKPFFHFCVFSKAPAKFWHRPESVDVRCQTKSWSKGSPKPTFWALFYHFFEHFLISVLYQIASFLHTFIFIFLSKKWKNGIFTFLSKKCQKSAKKRDFLVADLHAKR